MQRFLGSRVLPALSALTASSSLHAATRFASSAEGSTSAALRASGSAGPSCRSAVSDGRETVVGDACSSHCHQRGSQDSHRDPACPSQRVDGPSGTVASSSALDPPVRQKTSAVRRRTTSGADAQRQQRSREMLAEALSDQATLRPTDSTGLNEDFREGRSAEHGDGAVQRVSAIPASSLTDDELRASLSLTGVLSKLKDALAALTAPVTDYWTLGPSDSTSKHFEKQLDLAIRQGSFSTYATLRESMRKRLEHPLNLHAESRPAGSEQDLLYARNERFLLLYARLLTNYGALCLVNFATQEAVYLFKEAITMTEHASAAAARDSAKSQLPAARRSKRVGRRTRGALTKQAAPNMEKAADYACTAVLYIRVLLANALSCERLYWEASEQYLEVQRVLEQNPYDFQAGVSPRSLSPADALTQLVPGTAPYACLSRPFLHEDATLFFSQKSIVRQAASQGQAQQLLLQSQGASAQSLSRARLQLARLYRAASAAQRREARSGSMLHLSKRVYEGYLDELVARGEEDSQNVMLELGRMLCFDAHQDDAAAVAAAGENADTTQERLAAGIIYLEAAAEALTEEAESVLAARPTSSDGEAGAALSVAQQQVIVRATGVLLDVAEAHHRNDDDAAALGLYEGCIGLLQRGGLARLSAFALQRYAGVLAGVSFVDKAIGQYAGALEVLKQNKHDITAGEHRSPSYYSGVPQLGLCQRMVLVSSAMVEADLAFCYQTYVGDARRAAYHYQHAFDITTQHSWMQPRHRSRTSAPLEKSTDAPSEDAGLSAPPWTAPSDTRLSEAHFILTNMVACYVRLQDWETAVVAQNRLIEVESAQGANLASSYVRLVTLIGLTGDYKRQLALYFYLLLLPSEMLEVTTRANVAYNFAKCCYVLGNGTMGSILLNAVSQIGGDNDPAVLLDWALTVERLDAVERLRVHDAAEMKTGVETIANTFLRAAQMVIAHRVIDADDKEEEEKEHAVPTTTGTTPGVSAGPSEAGCASAEAAKLDVELRSLITLSRGAFFLHQNGFNKEAEDLYAAAVSMADASGVASSEPASTMSMVAKSNEYHRELAILLANYATLTLVTNPSLAEPLYERAAAIQPMFLEVAEVVADYYVQTGNYAKGAPHIQRVIQAHPASALAMHSRAARLGCGQPWAEVSEKQRLDILEHTVLALGIDPARVQALGLSALGDAAEKNPDGSRASALDALLLDGVTTTASDEAACLACFLVQTKLTGKSGLVNKLYKVAIRRFPFHTALLVNYAKFCSDFGFHALARKFYARAYGVAEADFCRTLCYVNYLSSSYGSQQLAAGESLYHFHVDTNPQSSQANMFYANYLAVMMPTPFKTEQFFQRGAALEPQSKHLGLYAQFVWACADNPVAYENADVRARLFDIAENLFKRALEVEPESPAALQNLGMFYANRRNRFEETVQTLHRAHRVSPRNAEIARQLCGVLLEECARVQMEEQQRFRAAARHSSSTDPAKFAADVASSGTRTPMASRLRSLMESTQQTFEKCLELEPTHRGTLEKYAGFAVTMLKNPSLAVELWKRIGRLDRK